MPCCSDLTATAGSDYVAAIGEVTIPAGQTSQTLTVLVNGDLLAESTEIFTVELTGASGLLVGDFIGEAFIIDDDAPPTISISDASVVEGNSGTKLMSFTVSLSNSSGAGLWVNYNTANGTATTSNKDYVATSGTLYFAPGQTTKTITVNIQGDTKKEKNEKFYVNLSGAVGATIADGQGVGTILNDDGVSQSKTKGSNQVLSALSVDAAIEDWMFSGRKKRNR